MDKREGEKTLENLWEILRKVREALGCLYFCSSEKAPTQIGELEAPIFYALEEPRLSVNINWWSVYERMYGRI